SALDQENYQKAVEYAKNNNFHEAIKESTQASKNISHTLSDEASKKLATDVSGSYETGINERSEASKSFSEAESFSQQAMTIRSNAASLNANYNQEFMEWLGKQPRDNATGKIGFRGAVDISKNPTEANEWGKQFMREKGIAPSMALQTNPN